MEFLEWKAIFFTEFNNTLAKVINKLKDLNTALTELNHSRTKFNNMP